MNIILVTDIFGKTPALVKLSEELNAKIIVDPYGGVDMAFKDEDEAYSYFISNIGFENYFSVLLKTMESINFTSTLVGFSIGASVIWKLSEKLSVKNVNCAICYYGSQIRNFKEVNPLFKVELIFPKKEFHFDVLKLKNDLSKKKNVHTTKVDYLHGFMNKHSTNYNQSAYNEQVHWLRQNTC
jgi:dienelactone hydrolase